MWLSMIVMWAVPLLIATHALKVVFSFCILTIQPKLFKENNTYNTQQMPSFPLPHRQAGVSSHIADMYRGAPLEV
jgi:hypothetical protein